MTRHTINGVIISDKAHSQIKEDCEFYASQCDNDDDDTDIILPINSPSVLENVLKFVDNNDSFPMIRDKTTTVLKVNLRDFYDMLELLHLMMSKNLKTSLISMLSSLVASHCYILNGIQNEFEFFEKAYLVNLESQEEEEGITTCEYRFTDDLWIDIKIMIFDLKITRCLGCSYVQVNTMTTLFRLEPKTELESRVRDLKSYQLVIGRIEYITDRPEKRIDLLDCRVYYTNGSMYRGSLRFDIDLGFQRHGAGIFYTTCDTDSEERDGLYLYNKPCNECSGDEECDCCFCTCENYRIRFEEDEDEDNEEDEDEEDEEEMDERKCFFNCSRNACLRVLNWEDIEKESTLYCRNCKITVLKHINDLYVSRNKVLSILSDFDLPNFLLRWRTKFDQKLNNQLKTLASEMDHFWEGCSLKTIKTYEDYMHYILVNPKRVSESNDIFHQKVQNIQQYIKSVASYDFL